MPSTRKLEPNVEPKEFETDEDLVDRTFDRETEEVILESLSSYGYSSDDAQALSKRDKGTHTPS